VGFVALMLLAFGVAACGGTDDTLADNPDPTYGPSITASEAETIALEATPGTLVETRVDVDRGVLVFDVVVERDDGVLVATQVAANTGEVLKAEQLLEDGRVPSDGGPVDSP
jgi:uncharacterized membrane protein YkoI